MHDSSNPYAAPRQDDAADPRIAWLRPAPRRQRFVNYVIDLVVFLIACFMAGGFFGFVDGLTGTDLLALLDGPTGGRVFGATAYVLFYLAFELSLGQTPGKMATATRIVTEEGGKPTAGQLLTRCVARLIPFEPFSVLTKDGVMWHDSLSKTRVVCDTREPRVDPHP